MQKRAKANEMVLFTYMYNISISINFNREKNVCSQNATNQTKSTTELGYMWPRGLSGSPAVTLAK